MLPQSAALGVSCEQKGKAKPRTNEIRAVFQHDRGERSAAGAGPSPAERRETSAEKGGVTRVFVLAKDGAPLMPCHAARARELLAKDKAVVVRLYPFVIRLKYNPVEAGRQPVALKIDRGPGQAGWPSCELLQRCNLSCICRR
jgi:hypothetical protein